MPISSRKAVIEVFAQAIIERVTLIQSEYLGRLVINKKFV